MNQPRGVYEFGPFLLDIGERRLLRNGEPVPLRAKVLETLRVLVENHGRLVAKDALMKAVWPDAVVEEGNLAHNVAALRKALASGEARSDHVEMVPGQGYRFVGRITMLGDLALSDPVSGSALPPSVLPWNKGLSASRYLFRS
jgi:DNA-binding winged helix-turn-helix (wHTH) protein